jgi:PAS domain S-box-containing protein
MTWNGCLNSSRKKSTKKGVHPPTQLRIIDGNGDVRHLDSWANTVSTEAGLSIVGTIVDRTEELAAKDLSERVIDAIPDMMFVVDREGTFLEYFPTEEVEVYLPPEMFMGKKVSEVMPKDLLPHFLQLISDAFDGQNPTYDYELELAVGVRCFEARAVPLNSDRCLVMARDTTLAVQASQELNKTAHDLGERVKEPRCLHEIEQIARTENLTEQQVFQQAVELIPGAWQYPGITSGRITVGKDKYVSGGFRKTRWIQSSTASEGGASPITVEVCYSKSMPEMGEGPFLSEERRLINTIAERLASYLHLKQQRSLANLLGAAIASVGDGIVITDREEAIQWVNAAFTSTSGYTMAEVLGKNPRILKSGRQKPGFYKDLWVTIMAGRTWTGTLENKKKSGDIYYEDMTITPVMGVAGEITHFVSSKRDVTLRVEATDRLEQRVREVRGLNRLMTGELAKRTGLESVVQHAAASLDQIASDASAAVEAIQSNLPEPSDVEGSVK